MLCQIKDFNEKIALYLGLSQNNYLYKTCIIIIIIVVVVVTIVLFYFLFVN